MLEFVSRTLKVLTNSEKVEELTERVRRTEEALQMALTTLETTERKNRELFTACQQFEAQRDRWAYLYRENTAGHAAAQALLERQVVRLREHVGALLKMLNDFRKQSNLPMIEVTENLKADGEPVGTVEIFIQRHKTLLADFAKELGRYT